MTIIFKKVFFRPMDETNFYSEPQEFLDYVKETYIDTGKCVTFREKTFLADDGSIQVVKSEWTDQAGYDQFILDTNAISDSKNIVAYNKENGIMLVEMGPD